jgi:hypothetical protein
LHVVVAQVAVGATLLRTDEAGELQRITEEEDRGVIADDVVIAFGGVKLQREAAQVTPGCLGCRSPATVENRITVSVVVPG